MKIAFRQGIIRYQSDPDGTPEYLLKTNNDGLYLDLYVQPDPCVLTFAHGRANYAIEEVHTVYKAWGPFQPTGQTQYLYWDIDTYSGQLSRGFTLVPPFVGGNAPSTPVLDQHWFDLNTVYMKVWNGESWVTKIRLFAGTYADNAVIIPMALGSQVGLDNYQGKSGSILFDDRLKPIRADDMTFLTSETNFHVNTHTNNPNSSLRFEAYLNYVKAAEYIPIFSCVSVVASNTVMLASYNNTANIVNGIVIEDMFLGDVSRLITSGIVFNPNWNFTTAQVGKSLFCGITGEITLTPPLSGVCQCIGTVESAKTINVSIQAPIYY